MTAFSGATLMITGGTGSFGNTVLKHFLETDIAKSAFSPVMKRNRTTCVTACRRHILKQQAR